MAWNVKADALESCSCAAMCPCLLGPAKPDQGWCSGLFALNVTAGNSDGVDLSGVKMLLHFELPGDFLGGIDKGKVYVDPSASDDQRREIDAIFHGEKGGFWGGMKEAIKEWLPTQVTKVDISGNSATIEGVGEVKVEPIKLEDGSPTVLTGAPIPAAFQIPTMNLAFGTGSKLNDPDMRSWESLGQGSVFSVEWSG